MTDTQQSGSRPSTQPAAPVAMIYVKDRDSEGMIRQCLSDLGVTGATYVSGGVAEAIADLAHGHSPRLLIVDISGTDDPTASITELAQVCEPSTGVIVVGDANDVVLYRNLKSAGVAEYFFRPLVRNLVSQACNDILTGSVASPNPRSGKLIFVMGARGGVGATTIGNYAAWYLAEVKRRRVALVDLDLSTGDAALQLDIVPNHTLREALERPERVDDLLLERGVIHVTPRLDIFASLEPLDHSVAIKEEAVLSLVSILLRRYRYVFVDLPAWLATDFSRLLHMPSTFILVSDASLVSARDVARWREMIGPSTAERTGLHIANKIDAQGSLPIAEFVRALGKEPDVTIPYEREIANFSALGLKGLVEGKALKRGLEPVLRQISGDHVEKSQSLLHRLLG